MKYYILASLIIFGLVIHRAARLQKKKKKSEDKDFWERERLADSVRRKSLEQLNYIEIPMEKLPLDTMPEDSSAQDCIQILRELTNKSVVNLTGYTNTDLKMEYGAANLALLSEYDQNYTLLVQALQKWADTLYKSGYIEEAQTVLEFSVSTRTDISQSYYLLAEIYAAKLEYSKIELLYDNVQSLRSANREAIARNLRKAYL